VEPIPLTPTAFDPRQADAGIAPHCNGAAVELRHYKTRPAIAKRAARDFSASSLPSSVITTP
jgi:predicted metal-dependent phosphoesterase TrpH